MMKISLVVAIAQNGVIGRGGHLPWSIPADMRHFKGITLGHPVIMGRKTWESIGKPLEGRINIVVTRQKGFKVPEGVIVTHSLDEALWLPEVQDKEVMIIGGAELYKLTLPRSEKIYLTEVDMEPEGDTYFPDFDHSGWRETSRRDFAGSPATPSFSFVTLERFE